MIDEKIKADILKFFYADKWKIGTIARYLSVHPSTVQRVLKKEGTIETKLLPKVSKLQSFLPFVLETLNKYPRLKAPRLYEMVYERGCRCSLSYFRHWLSIHRPQSTSREAYLRLKTQPGEEAQVDWSHCGSVQIGKAKRILSVFVMVLSFSRKVYCRFFFNQRMSSFLQGHEEAFNAFTGVPRILKYDNLKSLVTERRGDLIRFNETLLKFSGHYRFEAKPVGIARGNEKGRVERAIQYIKTAFLAGRTYLDLEDLNRQAMRWCEGIAADRPCPEDPSETVRSMFRQEQPSLLPLPTQSFEIEDRVEVRSGKTPYVRYDLNDYSVPYSYTRQLLTVLATDSTIRVVKGTEVLAEHPRSYDKGKQIENPSHIEALKAFKKKARFHSDQYYLNQSVPSVEELLKCVVQRGLSIRSSVKQLIDLLETYGPAELETAIQEAIQQDMPDLTSVQINLVRRREAKQLAAAVHLHLPSEHPMIKQLTKPHSLKLYANLEEESLA